MCERSTLNAVTKVWTGSDCETAERLLGLGAGGCLWLGAAVPVHRSEPRSTVTSIHALLRKAENKRGGVRSLGQWSYLPLGSVEQEKTSEGCFET